LTFGVISADKAFCSDAFRSTGVIAREESEDGGVWSRGRLRTCPSSSSSERPGEICEAGRSPLRAGAGGGLADTGQRDSFSADESTFLK